MTQPVGLSIILPCLNEAASVQKVIKAAKQGLAALSIPGEVIVVDNGSSDNSAELAASAGARVVHEETRGYGAAIRGGFAEASYPLLAMADADLSYDLTKLPDLVQPILDDEADFVLGNRLNGIHPSAMPALHQHVGNPMMTRLVRLMFRRPDILDAHSGFRIIRKELYEKLDCITTGMEFASEMIVRAILQDLRILFRDIEYHPRTGESKLRTFRDGWRHLRYLLLLKPSSMILLPGMVAWILSQLIALVSVPETLFLWGVLAVLTISGLQWMVMGVLAKSYAHLSGVRTDKLIATVYQRLSFETGALMALVLMIMGLSVFVFPSPAGIGSPLRFFFAVVWLINGIQLGTGAYLFSIMALPHRMNDADSLTDTGSGMGRSS